MFLRSSWCWVAFSPLPHPLPMISWHRRTKLHFGFSCSTYLILLAVKTDPWFEGPAAEVRMKTQCPLQPEEFYIHIFRFFEKRLYSNSVSVDGGIPLLLHLAHSFHIFFLCSFQAEVHVLSPENPGCQMPKLPWNVNLGAKVLCSFNQLNV